MELVDIQDWRSTDIRSISITQDVGGSSYPLRVREFAPTEGDFHERKWVTDGVQQAYQCKPYAIANMKDAGQTLSIFTTQTIKQGIGYHVDETDTLLRETYVMVFKYSETAQVSLLGASMLGQCC